jgi:hypothetical protein
MGKMINTARLRKRKIKGENSYTYDLIVNNKVRSRAISKKLGSYYVKKLRGK